MSVERHMRNMIQFSSFSTSFLLERKLLKSVNPFLGSEQMALQIRIPITTLPFYKEGQFNSSKNLVELLSEQNTYEQ